MTIKEIEDSIKWRTMIRDKYAVQSKRASAIIDNQNEIIIELRLLLTKKMADRSRPSEDM